MPFTIGKPKTGGRQPGVPNRLTSAFREAVLFVYDGLGGHDAFLEWARENQTEYYRIASRLIPAEMRDESSEKRVTVIIDRLADRPPSSNVIPVTQLPEQTDGSQHRTQSDSSTED
jgi:hypothetical protein